jgi:hypothetical protein
MNVNSLFLYFLLKKKLFIQADFVILECNHGFLVCFFYVRLSYFYMSVMNEHWMDLNV